MAEPDATQIVAGPGKLYVAALGSALPTVDGHGEYPVTWPAAWKAVGYTDAGIDIVYTPTIKAIMVDEEASPVSDVLSEEKFHLAAHLALSGLQVLQSLQLTLASLQHGMAHLTSALGWAAAAGASPAKANEAVASTAMKRESFFMGDGS